MLVKGEIELQCCKLSGTVQSGFITAVVAREAPRDIVHVDRLNATAMVLAILPTNLLLYSNPSFDIL
jgi:hypothetical protein